MTIKQFTTGTDALRAVQAGQIDAAWAPTPTALASIAKGADLVGIEGMDVVDWEVGSIDPSIKTCADLKGQTIGVDTVGGARYRRSSAMLSKCKLSINDVKTVNFPGAAGDEGADRRPAEGERWTTSTRRRRSRQAAQAGRDRRPS